MPPIVHSIEIDRPPEEVFSYITDPTRFAEWQYDVESVRIDDERPPSVGSRFTTIRRTGQAKREHHRRTSQRQHTIVCEDRARLQRTRDRRAARTRHPPDRSEGGA